MKSENNFTRQLRNYAKHFANNECNNTNKKMLQNIKEPKKKENTIKIKKYLQHNNTYHTALN